MGLEYTARHMTTPSAAGVRYVAASDCSLLVYFDSPAPDAVPRSISLETHEHVRRLVRLLEFEPIAGVRNLHPGYCSVLVSFDAVKLRHEQVQEQLAACIERMEKIPLPKPREVEIPVCYGDEYGPDLQDVAELHGLTPERVIKLHSGGHYVVYFLGFVPGFAYLGELPGELVTPRLSTPRKSVPAGSVGIAKNQTGVYPISTPGGWRLLGRTPAALFEPHRKEVSLLTIGDHVRFVPITAKEFAKLERA